MTSRPIMDAGFDDSIKMLSIKQADVLPMTNRDVSTFIDYWHNAISSIFTLFVAGKKLDFNASSIYATSNR